MFGLIGWWVAFPLALTSEAFAVITALSWFVDGVAHPGWLATCAVAASASLAAFFVGYALRDIR